MYKAFFCKSIVKSLCCVKCENKFLSPSKFLSFYIKNFYIMNVYIKRAFYSDKGVCEDRKSKEKLPSYKFDDASKNLASLR